MTAVTLYHNMTVQTVKDLTEAAHLELLYYFKSVLFVDSTYCNPFKKYSSELAKACVSLTLTLITAAGLQMYRSTSLRSAFF